MLKHQKWQHQLLVILKAEHLNQHNVCVAEVGPDPDNRSRLRQDSAFFVRTRIQTRSQ